MKFERSQLIILIFLLSFIGKGVFAQQERALADGFGQLALGQTTSEEAISYLGKIDSETTEGLKASELQRWLTPKHKEKIYKKLRFKNVEAFRLIELSFFENKLVMIDLVFRKEFSPANLKKTFGIGFATWSVAFGTFPSKPEKLDTQTKYEIFNPDYYRIGASEKTFILATCHSEMYSDPGKVERIIQISRIFEAK